MVFLERHPEYMKTVLESCPCKTGCSNGWYRYNRHVFPVGWFLKSSSVVKRMAYNRNVLVVYIALEEWH